MASAENVRSVTGQKALQVSVLPRSPGSPLPGWTYTSAKKTRLWKPAILLHPAKDGLLGGVLPAREERVNIFVDDREVLISWDGGGVGLSIPVEEFLSAIRLTSRGE